MLLKKKIMEVKHSNYIHPDETAIKIIWKILSEDIKMADLEKLVEELSSLNLMECQCQE